MSCKESWKQRIALILALVLLLTPVLQVSAEEIPEETEQLFAEETEAPEVPTETEVPEETEAATEPEEMTEPEETTESEETTEPEETTESEETTEPEATTEPEEPAEMEPIEEVPESAEPVLWSLPRAVPIAQVLGMEPSEVSMVIEGVVVFAENYQAVLQDETGGIRLSFASPPDIALGDFLVVTGHCSGGFSVERFEKTGTADLPAQESTLGQRQNTVRILVKGAVLVPYGLSQNGDACELVGTVPDGLGNGDRVDVWGVLLDGVFYADTILASEPQEPEAGFDTGWNFYFGQLHAHTDISDGTGTVQEAFAYAKDVAGLDFFAVTDHSNSFDNASQGAVDRDGAAVSQEWAAGKEAAKAVTDETFVGLFGYEMTWAEDLAIGHINTFGTPGWQTREQEGMDTLQGYLEALAAVPDSVSQFNHPGLAYGDFGSFAEYTPQQDARVHLLEVGSEGSFTAYDIYTTALDEGWHLAPSNNQNNHAGNWGDESPDRTVVLASALTEEAIYEAVRNYRVYATEDPDLKIQYCVNDRILGTILTETDSLTAEILLEDGSGDPIGRVEVITDGGTVAASTTIAEAHGECTLELPKGGSYYYLRILREEEIVAVTAPVWVDTYEDLGIGEFTADAEKPAQGTASNLTLTLYNHEALPFEVEQVTFAIGETVIETIYAPGIAAPVGQLEIPLTYVQETPGAVTITATVSGSVAGLSRTYRKEITLHYQAQSAKMRSVKEVRDGLLGEAYRIRGYVTAGTANPHNTFPDSIYLQDETGGIEIADFTRSGIQLGTPMEIEGILRSVGGNRVLAMTDYELLQEDYYRHVPRTMTHEVAMDYEDHGGELLQIEGHVVSVTKTADQQGVARFTLRDIVGDLATVMVEDGIGSGAYGTNELVSEVKNTSTVRAMGLLHIDEYGKPVLRVRNCDEVVYVPPVHDPSNPKTGDWFHNFA